jgi:hypothetical protein
MAAVVAVVAAAAKWRAAVVAVVAVAARARAAAAARRRWRLRRLQTGPLEGSIGTSPENLCWRKT